LDGLQQELFTGKRIFLDQSGQLEPSPPTFATSDIVLVLDCDYFEDENEDEPEVMPRKNL
jgi:hypothetical protein